MSKNPISLLLSATTKSKILELIKNSVACSDIIKKINEDPNLLRLQE